jgi:class 3 adenylate cyclase/tetratricopeptide (TPR) repeat protein
MSTDEQRRHLTVLFSDLVGSTSLAEQLEAEDYATVLASVRGVFEHSVALWGGTVLRVQGDGVLAVFGYPHNFENDSLKAVKAALAMHERVRAIVSRDLGLSIGSDPLELRLHTGIHSGLCLLQPGDVTLGRFELLGASANLSAAMCQCANSDEILVTRESLSPNLLRFIDYETVSVRLKGSDAPTQAIRPTRWSSTPGHIAPIDSIAGPLIGRASEMHMLQVEFDSVKLGHNRLVHISGEPGIGKTRLVQEFLASLGPASPRVLRGVCGEGAAAALPFQPFREMMAGQLSVISPGHSMGVEGELRHSEFASQVLHLLKIWSAESLTILFFDDWHWSDSATQQLVTQLLAETATKILVIVTSRSQNDILMMDLVKAIRLEPLGAESTLMLALAEAPNLSPFEAGTLAAESGGNPLLTKEISRFRSQTPSHSRRNHSGAGVSTWLNLLYETRLNGYSQKTVNWIRTASVIGLNFSPDILAQVSELAPGEDFYQELISQELIHHDRKTGLYQFKHGLIRDAIYASVGLRLRRELHRKIGSILEAATTSVDTNLQKLAYHFFEGADFEKAAHYAETAANSAHKISALDSAQLQYQIALRALDKLPKNEKFYLTWERVLNRYALSCVFDPSIEPIDVFSRARDTYLHRSDLTGKARSEYMLAYLNYALGMPREALRQCAQALETVRIDGNQNFVSRVRSTQGHAHVANCNYEQARALLEQAVDQRRANSGNTKFDVVHCYDLVCLGALYADIGHYEMSDGKFLLARQLLIGQAHEIEASLESRYSAVLIWQGRWTEALDCAQRAIIVSGKVRSLYLYAMGKALTAYIMWVTTRNTDYVGQLAEATRWLSTLNAGWLCEAAEETKNSTLLRRSYAQALLRARKGDIFGLPQASRAMAKHCFSKGDEAGARKYFNRGLLAASTRRSAHEVSANQLLGRQLGLQL